jgi:Ran GTPase-activating protein (RanGAP) involved in mRNA processing and transport
VYLRGKQLTDSHDKEIAIGLCSTHQGGYGNDNLEELYLHNNNISDEGARALGHALGKGGNPTLEVLVLRGNKIGDNGIRYLADALQVSNGLRRIDLGVRDFNTGNEITDKGAQYLYEALQENTRVTELKLDNNPIKDQGLIGKIQELVRRNKVSDGDVTCTKDAFQCEVGVVGFVRSMKLYTTVVVI